MHSKWIYLVVPFGLLTLFASSVGTTSRVLVSYFPVFYHRAHSTYILCKSSSESTDAKIEVVVVSGATAAAVSNARAKFFWWTADHRLLYTLARPFFLPLLRRETLLCT